MPLYSDLAEERKCAAEHNSKEGKTNMAASPQFADANKAQAWQKLTDLQQHMMGLITAVEDQLNLSDSPKLAFANQAAAVAEDTADAMHSTVETQQQQEQQDACTVTSGDDQQPHSTQTAEQLQKHTGDAETGAEGQHDKVASSENQDAAAVAAADEGAEATAACSEEQVRATHIPSCSWNPHEICCFVGHIWP